MNLYSICFIVCLAVLSTSAMRPRLPRAARSLNEQCLAAGHVSACKDINHSREGYSCTSVACMTMKSPRTGKHSVAYLKSAPDTGTICAPNKVCINKRCVHVQHEFDIPVQNRLYPLTQCKHLINRKRQ